MQPRRPSPLGPICPDRHLHEQSFGAFSAPPSLRPPSQARARHVARQRASLRRARRARAPCRPVREARAQQARRRRLSRPGRPTAAARSHARCASCGFECGARDGAHSELISANCTCTVVRVLLVTSLFVSTFALTTVALKWRLGHVAPHAPWPPTQRPVRIIVPFF